MVPSFIYLFVWLIDYLFVYLKWHGFEASLQCKHFKTSHPGGSAAWRGPGWSGMSPCLKRSCPSQTLCSRWKPMSCEDAHTAEPQDLQAETDPIFYPKPVGLIEEPLHNPASHMSWDHWAENQHCFLNPLGWDSLLERSLTHSVERKAFTSPGTCSSPSFYTSHLWWQKKPLRIQFTL